VPAVDLPAPPQRTENWPESMVATLASRDSGETRQRTWTPATCGGSDEIWRSTSKTQSGSCASMGAGAAPAAAMVTATRTKSGCERSRSPAPHGAGPAGRGRRVPSGRRHPRPPRAPVSASHDPGSRCGRRRFTVSPPEARSRLVALTLVTWIRCPWADTGAARTTSAARSGRSRWRFHGSLPGAPCRAIRFSARG